MRLRRRRPARSTLFSYTTLFRSFHKKGDILIPKSAATVDDLMNIIISSTDRKSTRLNSSHLGISYAVFCLKKKKRHYGVSTEYNMVQFHTAPTRATEAACNAQTA